MRLTRRAMVAGILSAPTVLRAGDMSTLLDEARGLSQLNSLIVRRGGETLVAEAIRGRPLDAISNVKSVSKTLLATLTGIAMHEGVLPGPDAPVAPLLGRQFGDARDEITLGHLLSMQAGLASTSGGNYGRWISSADWLDHALARPMEDAPGGRFIYSTGSWHILGAALTAQTGESLLTLSRRWLGRPLGTDFAPWPQDPQGRYLGGNDMALPALGLADFGDMINAGGVWQGAQVVPESWIETSWQPRARSPWSGDLYGYGWFLTRYANQPAAYARGYGGQMLTVLPESGLTVVVLSDASRPARSGGYFGTLQRLVARAAAQLV
ncbi:MAG: serine hydrolase domain-containing protein [Pseudomonadota bacterium]